MGGFQKQFFSKTCLRGHTHTKKQNKHGGFEKMSRQTFPQTPRSAFVYTLPVVEKTSYWANVNVNIIDIV